jgi:hypothetical protein
MGHTAPRLVMPGSLKCPLRGPADQRESLGGPGGQRAGPLWKKLISYRLAVYFLQVSARKPAALANSCPARACARHQDWHVFSARHVQGS